MWPRNKQEAREKDSEPTKVKLFNNPLKAVETTIISAGSKFEGHFETAGTLIVDGSVTGNIKCSSLEILQDGNLEAQVEAENVSVAGSFKGEMICNGKFTVFSKGKVIGDVSYGTLSIEFGGTLDGSVSKSNSDHTPILPLYQEEK